MKFNHWKKRVYVLTLVVCMLLSLLPVSVLAEPNTNLQNSKETIYLSTTEDILELAENCRLNSWSEDKTVVLKNDIDMSESDFSGIPTFGGKFLGQKHTIKGIDLKQEGSVVGLFRYLQKTAVVEHLNVEAIVEPEGSKNVVGGLVGNNKGTIINCSFKGSVSGYEQIGGIAGVNEASGTIKNCIVYGMIHGNHFVGGIAGENQGVIRNCDNNAKINTKSVENSVSIEDITMDSLIHTENASTTTDVGGIVGINTGVIRGCTNNGEIGYQSMGYNIGGIAGTQNGYLVSCVNRADVQGRKEVGGIVGHLEPNIVVDFDTDTLQILSGQVSELEKSMSALEGSVQDTASDLDKQLNGLEDDISAVENSMEVLTESTEDFSESMEAVMVAVEEYVNAANALLEEIKVIAESDETKQIKAKTEELESALKDLEESMNVEEVMTNFDKVSKLLSELMELVGDENSSNGTDINTTIDEIQKVMDALMDSKNAEELEANLEKLNKLLDDLQKYFDEYSQNAAAIKTKISELQKAMDELSKSMNMEEVKANYEKVNKLMEELEKLIDTSSAANSPKIEAKQAELEKATDKLSAAMEDEGLEANYDKVIAATNNLGSAMDNLSTESKKMVGELEDSMDGLSNSLQDVSNQIDKIAATIKGMEEGIQISMEDVSDEDTTEDTVGKVYKCNNYGAISGDLNIGGIAGIMAEENDLDEDAGFAGEESLNATGKARVVVRDCENYGTVSATKQYVGGVVGYMMLGAVIDSVNAGGLDALHADYVGGIAGASNAVIRDCSSKSIIAGDAYVGGIAGQGNKVTGCYAFVDIQAFTEKAGAILGAAKELPEGEEADTISDNYYFIKGQDIGGIDGITYSGATDKKSLKKFLKLSDLHKVFKIIEVRFIVEGQEDTVLTINTGDSLTINAIPTLKISNDMEYEWEIIPEVVSENLAMGEVAHIEYLSEKSLTNILFNQTYKAAYDLKDTVIQGSEKLDNKLAVVLAEGTFAKDTTIELIDMLSTEPVVNGTTVMENWKVEISNEGVSKLHYHIPEGVKAEAIKLYVKDASGNWSEREFVLEGTYLVFDFEAGETGFALEKNLMVYAWRLAVVFAAAVLLLVFLHRLLKKRKNKKKQEK